MSKENIVKIIPDTKFNGMMPGQFYKVDRADAEKWIEMGLCKEAPKTAPPRPDDPNDPESVAKAEAEAKAQAEAKAKAPDGPEKDKAVKKPKKKK